MPEAPRRLCVLALALGLLAGCTQWQHFELGEPISEQALPRVEEGWSRAQVLERFGPPLRMSRLPRGTVMAWEYWTIDEYQVGLSLGPVGADLVNVDWGNARVSGDFLIMTFNEAHRLTAVSFEEWDRSAGGGQSLQGITSVVGVVDTDDLTRSFSTHLWGAQSLRPLPVTLNQANRLDTGASGIERRGGSDAIGQHSLELQ